MGELYINNTSQRMSSEYNNTTDDYYDYDYGDISGFYIYALSWEVVSWIIFCISLLLILVAFYLVFSLVRNDHIVPIYIINLLISDLVHICSQTISVQSDDDMVEDVFFFISGFSEISSIGFTVCVALERYLVIAHPLWYRFSQPIKISILISVLVWLFPLVFVCPAYFGIDITFFSIIFHLIPLPLFIFFLAGAVRALSAAIHITSTEKQRIIGTLVLPVLTYSLIFLPYNLWALVEKIQNNNNEDLSSDLVIIFCLSPPANAILYAFIRKGALDKLLACPCCKADNNETNTIPV